ncbi:MAG: hypothetical protein CMO40_05565 [Verrucomicrobiaceae bacterium]|nr:hypothetical protein [Verrucomicrobiaceae bacterium]
MANQDRPTTDGFKAPDPEELNSLLPAYEVMQLVAFGGTGAIYLARQKSLDRNIALKVLPREFGKDSVFRERFEAEAKAMARLRHPNLIGVHDFGEAGGYLYLTMDFVDGKSLSHSARGKAIAQLTAAHVVLGICEGLSHAHKAGIVHRDIKPANILIGSDRKPRIGDFGLALDTDANEGTGLDHGTPGYAGPEVMQDPSQTSKRSDVYAVGVILYELLTGELPGSRFSPPSRTTAQDVDARFDKIIRRAIHPAPGMRFADAGEMASKLKPLLDSLSGKGSGGLAIPRESEGSAKLNTEDELEEADERAFQQNETLAAMAANESRRYDRQIAVKVLIIAILLMSLLWVWSAYNRRKEEAARDEAAAKRLKEAEDLRGPVYPWENLRRAPSPPPSPGSVTAGITPQPRELTLYALQNQLVQGQRSRFPEGTWDLSDDRKAYFVRSAMSWSKAGKFAEAYGAHLVTLRSPEDRSALISKLPEGKTTWLGGGMTGGGTWGWVDGSISPLSSPAEASGRFLAMSGSGTIRAVPGKSEYPFFLVWRLDGSNPGSTTAQFERFKLSIDQRRPVFPPGTVTSGGRHYLVVERRTGWTKARDFARETSGHLAIPGSQAEHDYLKSLLATALREEDAAWLGGQFARGAWRWVTSEPWAFTAWAPKPAAMLDEADSALCLQNGTEAGWDNLDPGTELPAFIIEWSKDQFGEKEPQPEPSEAWKTVRVQCTVSLETTRKKFLKLLMDNGAGMRTELEKWYNGLALQDRGRQFRAYTQAKAKVTEDGRINEEGRFPPLPAEIASVCNARLRDQRNLDQEYASLMEKARATYVRKMEELLLAGQRERQFTAIRAIEGELQVTRDVQSFVDHFEITGE